MKKYLFLVRLFVLFGVITVNAQTTKLFDLDTRSIQTITLQNNFSIQGAVFLNPNQSFLKAVTTYSQIEIPMSESNSIILNLEEQKITTSDYKTITGSGQQFPISTLTKFFKGKVAGKQGSMVALTVTNETVEGFIIMNKKTYTIGKIINKSSNVHILYDNENFKESQKFSPNESDVIGVPVPKNIDSNASNLGVGCKQVRIYMECDNYTYLNWGGNLTTVTNQIMANFNQVKTLYANENVDIILSSLKVWDTVEPYTTGNTSNSALDAFRAYWNGQGNSFNGDIAHLVSSKNLGGGVAYYLYSTATPSSVNDVKAVFAYSGYRTYSYGVSGNINNSVATIPTYSWNVEVISHELGHNFGLPHTHSCFWAAVNGGSTIDNCYGNEGGSCSSGPTPVGGTIMSYCHLSSIGINFSYGFGMLPRNKMQSEVIAATSLLLIGPVAPTSTPNTRCGTGTLALSATGCSGTYNWYGASTGGLSLGATAAYTTPSINTSTTYYVDCTVDNCTSTRTAVVATINAIPASPTISSATINSGQTATLTATGCSGSVAWFTTSSGGVSIATGASFTTPALTTTTTYYGSCIINTCESATRGIGTVTVNACTASTATLSGTQTITAGQNANLSVALTGTSPWSVVINGVNYTGIPASPFNFTLMPNTTTTYNISSVSNGCGTGIFSGSAIVTVNPVSNPCPQTATYPTGVQSQGAYSVSETIISRATPSGPASYTAGKSITMLPGFIVNRNTSFTARIQGCTLIPTSGLIAYYSFDGSISDVSGNNNNLTATGTTSSVSDRKNQPLKARGYGGNTSIGYQTANNSVSFAFTTGMSVSLWYKLPSYAGMDGYRQQNANGYQILIAKEGDRSGFYIGISNDATNNKQAVNFTNNPSNGVSNFNISANPDGTAVSNLNKWIHLVATAGNGNVKIYFDGILKNTVSVSNFDFSGINSRNLFVGTMYALGTIWYPYSGSLDEVRMFNRALTDAEVQSIYNFEKN